MSVIQIPNEVVSVPPTVRKALMTEREVVVEVMDEVLSTPNRELCWGPLGSPRGQIARPALGYVQRERQKPNVSVNRFSFESRLCCQLSGRTSYCWSAFCLGRP